VKPIKVLGLIALMSITFVNAQSAKSEPYTALCNTDPGGILEPCPGKNIITHFHETSVVKSRFLSSAINVECDVLVLGEVLGELANPLTVHLTYTITNCTSGCTVKEENGPAESKLTREGHETTSVVIELLMHISCSGFIDCSYNGIGLKGTAKGPLLATNERGEVVISEQVLNKESGGFLCPKTAKLDITTTGLGWIWRTS
jgi:hypothetical protein